MTTFITSNATPGTASITTGGVFLTSDSSIVTDSIISGTATYSFNSTIGSESRGRSTAITDSDIIFADGTSLMDAINKINERLCVLIPDPELLEKYEALRDAYEKYKVIEALLKKTPNIKDL